MPSPRALRMEYLFPGFIEYERTRDELVGAYRKYLALLAYRLDLWRRYRSGWW